MPRRLNHRSTTERLRAAIQRRRKIHHWGHAYLVTPLLVTERFGDGKRLIWLQPLNTRPNYYVVRVDSGWKFYDEWEEGDEDFRDHLDDILEAVENDFGSEHDWETGKHVDWPALDLWAGCAWGDEQWPIEHPARKAIANA